MKRLSFILCALAMTLAAHSQEYLKLMSYNIRNTTGMDNISSSQRIADVITRESPDVVAIQEADSMTTRSEQRYVLGEIAEHTQMYASYAPAIDFQGGKYGIGILSREKPLAVHRYAMPGREERRALIVAEFAEYIFCCSHFSLTEEDRLASIDIIKQIAASYEGRKPFFFAGDLNAKPTSSEMKALAKDFVLLSDTLQPTFPSTAPSITIDYIAAWRHGDNCFANLAAQVIDEPVASDHRPLTVQLRMPIKADELFVTKPYLQNPTEDGITVMWETSIPTYSWVEYGTDTTQLSRARVLINGQAKVDDSLHKIRLDGLIAGQTYYYRVCSREILQNRAWQKVFGHTAQSEFHSFELPEPDTEDFTAVVFNDLHCNPTLFKSLLKQIEGIEYDFAVFNGDCVSDPEDREQATWFIKILTEGIKGSSVPTFFVRGNHEVREAYSTNLPDHFDFAGGNTYGAFSWGDTRIVMLDCGESNPDSLPAFQDLNDFAQLRQEQAQYLQEELKSKAFKKADKRILIHHIPLFGQCKELWAHLLNKADFDVALNGHTHRYAHHAVGTKDNAYPILVGGGKSLSTATVMIIEKHKGELRIKVLNTKGEVLFDITA